MTVCYSPLKAFRDSQNNIIFDNSKGQGICALDLPCGQCIGCRLNHAEGWAVRMVHEAQLHEENSFITLTYNDENLPEGASLNYKHPQKFIKKLRKALSKTKYKDKIRFYRVGEYGDKLGRPHYHLIIFGFDFKAKLRYKGKENELSYHKSNSGNDYYESSMLTDLWDMGRCDVGEVNYNTCMYVAKYVTKKINGAQKHTHYGSKEPEKASMSKRPAIGYEWLKTYYTDVYNEDSVIHDGRRLRTPSSYDKWLEKNNPELYEEIKQDRENSIRKLTDQKTLTMQHENKVLSQKQFKRNLDTDVTPTNELDKRILNYHKKHTNQFHLEQKQRN